MAQIDLTRAVGELVAERPELSRVFDELQIDYCCHGSNTLQQACQLQELDPSEALAKLASPEVNASESRDWLTAPLSEMCDHIEQTHHAYLRTELPRLEQLIAKVTDVHGDKHSELLEVKRVFQGLRAELIPHMMKEEQVLFPAIREIEIASQPLNLPFGTVQNPIHMMEHEHDNAGSLLSQMRSLTSNYTAPKGICSSYLAMLDGLRELELDLHLHIHKENNILFPRAAKLEASLGDSSQ
ncbi:MAG: iron-sulfur cluster repair di-iron protein [Planctomycetes bacterium]|nr:iron-sulfur cluster repair di-iron protein [Planctomycetota bacterium]